MTDLDVFPMAGGKTTFFDGAQAWIMSDYVVDLSPERVTVDDELPDPQGSTDAEVADAILDLEGDD